MDMPRVEKFLSELADWAYAEPDIQAVAVIGSYARNSAHKTSDIDLILITQEPDRYLQNQAWIQRFGNVYKQQVENYGPVTSIRVWYTEGHEVEYGMTDETCHGAS